MSKDKTAAKGGEFADLQFEAPKEAVNLGESYIYRAGPTAKEGGDGNPGIGENKEGEPQAHCGWLPIQGYLAERVWRDSDKFDKEGYFQYVIRLTKPCLGITDNKHVRLKVGDFVCITESGATKALERFATHPLVTLEVYLRPTGETKKTPNGPMKVWECKRIALAKRADLNLTQLPELPDGDLPPQLQGDITAPALPAKSA